MQKKKFGNRDAYFYYAEEVEEKVFELESRIRELENELSISKNNNRGGNVANLTPRQPTYDERIQREIARRVELGESKNKLSKEFNVSRGTILNYCRKFEHKKTVKPQLNFSEELIIEDVPPVKNYFPQNNTNPTVEPVTKISSDPLASVPSSNVFGTKSISADFRKRD